LSLRWRNLSGHGRYAGSGGELKVFCFFSSEKKNLAFLQRPECTANNPSRHMENVITAAPAKKTGSEPPSSSMFPPQGVLANRARLPARSRMFEPERSEK
jgi:hypothetical protein